MTTLHECDQTCYDPRLLDLEIRFFPGNYAYPPGKKGDWLLHVSYDPVYLVKGNGIVNSLHEEQLYLMIRFCPFCGKKLEEPQESPHCSHCVIARWADSNVEGDGLGAGQDKSDICTKHCGCEEKS
ncbi:MAG: hypothetical protein M3M85_03005 [bacterium]|nr:hypothetical protein [bacterium]